MKPDSALARVPRLATAVRAIACLALAWAVAIAAAVLPNDPASTDAEEYRDGGAVSFGNGTDPSEYQFLRIERVVSMGSTRWRSSWVDTDVSIMASWLDSEDGVSLAEVSAGAPRYIVPDHSLGHTHASYAVASGWPFRALDGGYSWRSAPGQTGNREWHSALEVTRGGADPLLVPFRPRWIGLLANAAAYFTCISVVSLLASAVRRRWAISQGRCPSCLYVHGGDTPCPECGAAPGSQSRGWSG